MRPSQVASLCSGEETILNHTVFDCLNVDTNQVGVELIDMEHSSYVNNVNKTNSPTYKRPSWNFAQLQMNYLIFLSNKDRKKNFA